MSGWVVLVRRVVKNLTCLIAQFSAAHRNRKNIGTEPNGTIEIENHATLFLRSTLLAAWIAGACAQSRLRRRRPWRAYSS